MNVVKSVILSIFVTGCGFYPAQSFHIDPELLPYVEEYKFDKLFYLNSISFKKMSIIFDDMSADFEGKCITTLIGNPITGKVTTVYRAIKINRTYWDNFNNTERKLLMYHELGHCDLNLRHTSDYTIMNEYGILDTDFELRKDYYLNSLFIKGK